MRNRAPVAIWLILIAFLPPLAGAAGGSGRVRGWVQGGTGELPDGTAILEETPEGTFVELSTGAVDALRRRGGTFRPFPAAHELVVGGLRIDVREGQPPVPERWRAAPASARQKRPYLVKFLAPPRQEKIEELRRLGARPVQYVPAFGYLVILDPGADEAVAEIDGLEFHGEYHPYYKAGAELRDLVDGEGSIILRLVLLDLPGWESVVTEALGAGGRVIHRSDLPATSQRYPLHYAIIEEVPVGSLPGLLAAPQVYFAERWLPPQPEDERAAQIVAGNVSGGMAQSDYYGWLAAVGADGGGITVAVADSGLDTGNVATIHPDFAGRVTFATGICASNEDASGHGTNVTSIAVGDPRAGSGGTGLLDGSGFHWGGGSAPGADLYFQKAIAFGCNTADAATLSADAVGVGGALLGSHSFTDGTGAGNTYNSQAQAWDAAVRDSVAAAGLQPYAVFFSAGNSGPGSGTLTSPKAAKNIVVVGATENDRPGECPGTAGCGGSADDIDQVVSFSSRGPTSDGRLKPDVVTPGHVISGAFSSAAGYSCTCDGGGGGGCCDSTGVDGTLSYTRYSGTSQASPRAAGAAAVAADWYLGTEGSLPSPAMLKALLINSAVDLKAADVPNNDEGWGRIALKEVLQSPQGVHFADQLAIITGTGDGGAVTTNLYVQDPAAPLKATLVWTDAPGTVNCDPCLVNDLDLILTQGADSWLGNNFQNGLSTAGGAADALNNVEGILLPAGSLSCGSTFEVKVRAQTLAGDGVPGIGDGTDQDYALVVRNAGLTPGSGPPSFVVPGSTVSAGCDGDEFLDRTETVNVAVDLENTGCTSATGVTATMSVAAAPAGALVTVTPSTPQVVGNVATGEATQLTWQVSLADDAGSFCGDALVLQVDVAADGGGAWQDTTTVILDGEGFAPTVDLDTADTDRSSSADVEWSLQGCQVTSAPTSWHMGQGDCSGIPRDSSTRDLVFTYALGPGDRLGSLSFQHAFDGYGNATFQDTVTVSFDHDNDGIFDDLQTWTEGVDNPTVMSPAGPFDLSGFNAGRADQVSVRFRFQSAANWVGGPNNAAGWDVDDVTLAYDAIACDPATCVACPAAPPAVPDGSGGSSPLTVTPNGADLTLAWEAVPEAVRYNLYAGALGSFYSHESFADVLLDGGESCHEPGNSVSVTMPAGNVYFLVAADNGCVEGIYGEDSQGAPIPFATVPCSPSTP